MLEQLTIRDLALVKHATLVPAAGLTVISGETGGGKTLIVQALRLARGEKAKADCVRHGAKAACVDAVFRLSEGERSERVRALYEEVLGVAPDEDRVVLSRVVGATGRSRARIDGRPVTLRDLARFGSWLIEVHGQGSHRSLMRPEIQTELLDAFAGLTERRAAFAGRARELRRLDAELQERLARERESKERVEFVRFCLREIDEVAPQPGEHAELDSESKILGNLDRLQQVLGAGIDVLQESDASVCDAVTRVARQVGELTRLDPRLFEATRLLEEAGVLLDEAARELQQGLGRLDLDPGRAAEVDARLAAIDRLLERFGPSERELFASRERFAAELDALEDEDRQPAALEAKLAEGLGELARLGDALTSDRRRGARRLSKALVRELARLGMERTRVEVRVDDIEGPGVLGRATDLGTSAAGVYLAPNPGEPMTPLRETASGGEVARVMLVLKKILADADRVPVLVFDEIDAEIGGRLGLAVGRKLKDVAASHQVLCVTHLPQIAAFGDAHWQVAKRVEREGSQERTVTEVRALSEDARTRELASMARGDGAVDELALQEAGRLLEEGR